MKSWVTLARRVLAEQRALRVLAMVAGAVGLVALLVTLRVVVSSRAELHEAERLRDAGDPRLAIVHYRRAIAWYAPGNPFSSTATEALAALARRADSNGKTDLALHAWRALRGGLMASRSFYTPGGAHMGEANQRIAELLASARAPAIDAGAPRDALRGAHLALLQGDARPAPGLLVLVLCGFGTWVGGAFLVAQRAFDSEGGLRVREATRWAALALAGFVLLIVGLLLG